MNQLGNTGLGPTGIGGASMNLGNGANYVANYGANYGANSNFGVGGFNGRAANSYGLTGKEFDKKFQRLKLLIVGLFRFYMPTCSLNKIIY